MGLWYRWFFRVISTVLHSSPAAPTALSWLTDGRYVCDEEMGRKEEIRRERWERERERGWGLRWVKGMWADEGKGEETGGETGREEIERRKGERAER